MKEKFVRIVSTLIVVTMLVTALAACAQRP